MIPKMQLIGLRTFKFWFSQNLLLNIHSYAVDRVYITVSPFLMLEFYVIYALYYIGFFTGP